MEKKLDQILYYAFILLTGLFLTLQLVLMGITPAFIPNLLFFICLPLLRFFYLKRSGSRGSLIKTYSTDRRTGLPNREKLRLDIIPGGNILFLINIDSFKEVNDYYGNLVGDRIIISMADRLKSLLVKNPGGLFDQASLYKLKTDEYGILMNCLISTDQIKLISEVITNDIQDTVFAVGLSEVSIQITQGISSLNGDDSGSSILVQADMALKRAKKHRLTHLIYSPDLEIFKEYENNIRWTRTVRQSIKEDRVIPYYQPIVNNRNGKIEKYECLMRIIDDEEGIIYPEKFLKISKRSRLYPSLTRMMVSKIMKEMKGTDLDYTINITVEDIQNRDTVSYLRWLLEENWKEAPRICFEILESESLDGIEELPSFIRMIRNYGCSIALDDFGTGYSNFHYIMKLDADYIKIDASIIRNLDCDANALAIAETIVGFAKRTGIRTVAEYVHSSEIFRIVKDLGIDYSQGFYLGEPEVSSLNARCSLQALCNG